jgi:hypothetical protein
MVEAERKKKLCLDHRGDGELMALTVVDSRLEVDGWIGWFFMLLDNEEETKAPHVGADHSSIAAS